MAGFSCRHWKAFRAGRGVPEVQALTSGSPRLALSMVSKHPAAIVNMAQTACHASHAGVRVAWASSSLVHGMFVGFTKIDLCLPAALKESQRLAAS